VADLSSEGSTTTTAAASADTRGAPLLVRLENDTAWLQVAISGEINNHHSKTSGSFCASLSLTIVEHDPSLEEESKKPITVPFLVTFPGKCLL